MTTAVRSGGPGAKGISVLVIETGLPGFSARKIKNSGVNAGSRLNPMYSHCRRSSDRDHKRSAWVTLDNVKVPVENLVGEENKGFLTLVSSR